VRIPVRITALAWGLVVLSPTVALAAAVPRRAEAVGCRSMICLANGARAAQGLPQLRESRRLDRASRLRALAIRRCGQFSHTACGEPFNGVFARAGYRGGTIGENLAWGTGVLGTPSRTLVAWLGSPPHRRNLLGPGWREVGVACIHARRLFGASNVAVWVMEFGGRA
jgi:uncharacterized protein YkwD